MPRHLTSAVPSERTIQFFGQLSRLLDQRLNEAVAILIVNLCQHDKTGVAFDPHGDEAVAKTSNYPPSQAYCICPAGSDAPVRRDPVRLKAFLGLKQRR